VRSKSQLLRRRRAAGRVLPFEMGCTRTYADVLPAARKAGSGIEAVDAVIAALSWLQET